MLRALWFMIKVALLTTLALWVANQPGSVDIEWLNYEMRMHLGLFLLACLGFFLLMLMVYTAVRGIASLPGALRDHKQARRQQKGYRALTLGLSAVAAGDRKLAVYHAHRACDFLPGDAGLPLLLKAQAARLDGRDEEARACFRRMLEDKDAAFLGLKGLMQDALQSGDLTQALALTDRALDSNPRQPWILKLSYDLLIQRQDWDTARIMLYRAQKVGAVDAAAATSDRIAMLLIEAENEQILGHGRLALQKLKKAYQFDNRFTPVAIRYAQALQAAGKRSKAVSVIESTWKRTDHPDLALAWRNLIPPALVTESAGRMRWTEKLLKLHPASAEAHFVCALTALEERLWGEARQYLREAEALMGPGHADKRIYEALARLEDLSGASSEAASHWLEKARQARPAHGWVCQRSHVVFDRWRPLIMADDVVGSAAGSVQKGPALFNTLRWQAPSAGSGGFDVLMDSSAFIADGLLDGLR